MPGAGRKVRPWRAPFAFLYSRVSRLAAVPKPIAQGRISGSGLVACKL